MFHYIVRHLRFDTRLPNGVGIVRSQRNSLLGGHPRPDRGSGRPRMQMNTANARSTKRTTKGSQVKKSGDSPQHVGSLSLEKHNARTS